MTFLASIVPFYSVGCLKLKTRPTATCLARPRKIEGYYSIGMGRAQIVSGGELFRCGERILPQGTRGRFYGATSNLPEGACGKSERLFEKLLKAGVWGRSPREYYFVVWRQRSCRHTPRTRRLGGTLKRVHQRVPAPPNPLFRQFLSSYSVGTFKCSNVP